MIMAVTVPAIRLVDRTLFAKPWIWIAIPPCFGATLWMVFAQPHRLKEELSRYSFEPHPKKLLDPPSAELSELVAECQRTKPGPIAIVPLNRDFASTVGTNLERSSWLPVNSIPLYNPLSAERKFYYLDI